jgi:hypothetical protein
MVCAQPFQFCGLLIREIRAAGLRMFGLPFGAIRICGTRGRDDDRNLPPAIRVRQPKKSGGGAQGAAAILIAPTRLREASDQVGRIAFLGAWKPAPTESFSHM